MIYQMKLVIRDEERDITDFIYHCHISHHNDPDLDKMIELHIKICEETGNREALPIEGDLIALTFNSTNHDQFFYDWLFEGAMHDGEIQFIYNEVEIADNFRFWDCYCLGVEESMSVGGAPMRITVFLSPGIIKRNNLEAREKVWKVSSPSTDKKVADNDIQKSNNEPPIEQKEEKKEIQITEVYWKDANGEHNIDTLPEDEIVTLWACTKNASPGDKISFIIKDDTGSVLAKVENCEVNSDGVAIVKLFQIERENSEKSLEETK